MQHNCQNDDISAHSSFGLNIFRSIDWYGGGYVVKWPWQTDNKPAKSSKRRPGKHNVVSPWVYNALVTCAKLESTDKEKRFLRDIADDCMVVGIAVHFGITDAILRSKYQKKK